MTNQYNNYIILTKNKIVET